MDERDRVESVSAKDSSLGDIEGRDNEGHVDDHDTDTDPNLEMLQSEIRYWKRQNILLHKMVDDHKHFASEKTQLIQRNSGYSIGQPFGFCILPDLVIKEILKKVQDQQTLLNCRLVCVKWNQFIKDSQLIGRINFAIWHANLFLKLHIVNEGKVKSISLKNCSLVEHKRSFIDLVSNSIEKVEFAFEDETLQAVVTNSYKLQQLFELIFGNCPKLQEITWRNGPLNFLTYCTIMRRQVAAANQIRIVTMYAWDCLEFDAKPLIEFLMLLPSLKRIKLFGSLNNSISSRIMSGLCEYINKYGSATQLKELSLEFGSFRNENSIEIHQEFSEFLLLCDQHKIQLEELPKVTFNHLLSSVSPNKMPRPALGRSPRYQNELNGDLHFEGPKVTNLDRFSGVNIGELTLYFKRDVMNGELSWVKNVYAINSLILNDELEPKGTKLGQPSIDEFDAVFSSSIPTLKKLTIESYKSNAFSSIVFRWAQYFPNLTTLSIDSCGNSLETLIVELTPLEFLTRLHFWHFPSLLDATFTADCVNRFHEAGGNSSMSPAITCFKSLKFLGLYWCSGLTDACVINGISKSKTLEQLTVQNCPGITIKCEELCEFEIDFDNEVYGSSETGSGSGSDLDSDSNE